MARNLASPKNASAKFLAKSLAKGYLARHLASQGMGYVALKKGGSFRHVVGKIIDISIYPHY